MSRVDESRESREDARLGKWIIYRQPDKEKKELLQNLPSSGPHIRSEPLRENSRV